jgi:hypothetical protein
MKLCMFRAVPLPITGSLFTVHSAVVYVIQLSSRTRMEHPGPARKLSSILYDIPVPCVQWINSWWWIEELLETCRVSCRSKFGKLVHLVGCIIKMLYAVLGTVWCCHIWWCTMVTRPEVMSCSHRGWRLKIVSASSGPRRSPLCSSPFHGKCRRTPSPSLSPVMRSESV